MDRIYITFGQAHVHRVNNIIFDHNCVAVIPCINEGHGRKKAFEYFGDKWAFSYDEKAITEHFMSYFPRGLIELS